MEEWNQLMRAQNGNTTYRHTHYPHAGLRDHLHQGDPQLLVIVTHNGRTLHPKPVTMNALLHTTPAAPDIIVLPETHHTKESATSAAGMWRANQYNLRYQKKGANANAASGVALALRTRMAGCRIISHDPMGRHIGMLIPLAQGHKLLVIGVYAPQKSDGPARQMLADQLTRLLQI
jgi:exonuclease III